MTDSVALTEIAFAHRHAPGDGLTAALFVRKARVAERFWEFFTGNIRNPHTRRAYYNAVGRYIQAPERRKPLEGSLKDKEMFAVYQRDFDLKIRVRIILKRILDRKGALESPAPGLVWPKKYGSQASLNECEKISHEPRQANVQSTHDAA
jgi:hypothetical protein